ncbi:MAG: TetR/AcrR family transcriptional regulator [Gordonia sp. (in: high G+C Gram-positive bacteria)]
MPKIVDHDQRRREIVEATWQVIARDGVDAVTMRHLAEQMGMANGALARYFANKGEILAAVMAYAVEATNARFAEAGGHEMRGSAALRAFLHEAFPFEEVTTLEALIVIPFFQYAQHDEKLRKLWEDSLAPWIPMFGHMFEQMINDGEARPDLDFAAATDLIFTVISGVQANALLLPERGTTERLDRLVDSVLASLR